MAQVFPINETGLYYFILVNCMGSGAVRPNRFHRPKTFIYLFIYLQM